MCVCVYKQVMCPRFFLSVSEIKTQRIMRRLFKVNRIKTCHNVPKTLVG